MKINKMLKLIGLLGAFTLAVGCAGSADQPDEQSAADETPDTTSQATDDSPDYVESGGDMDSYEVSRGDHLWGISGNSDVYGNPYKWPLIYKANSDKIQDADLIYPGQVLDINTDPSDSESASAVSHAKSRGSWSIGANEDSDQAYLSE